MFNKRNSFIVADWVHCPVCGNKTRKRIREDTILGNYPLYCPKCKQETLKACGGRYCYARKDLTDTPQTCFKVWGDILCSSFGQLSIRI